MTRRLFLLSLMLSSMVVLPITVKTAETIEYGIHQLGGVGKIMHLLPDAIDPTRLRFVQQEDVRMCFIFNINEDGDLLGGQINISIDDTSEKYTMYFTGSFSDKDTPNMRITFFPRFYSTGNPPVPISEEEPIAFAVGFIDGNRNDMSIKLIFQSPNLIGAADGYGAFTGNFELTEANAETFCAEP